VVVVVVGPIIFSCRPGMMGVIRRMEATVYTRRNTRKGIVFASDGGSGGEFIDSLVESVVVAAFTFSVELLLLF